MTKVTVLPAPVLSKGTDIEAFTQVCHEFMSSPIILLFYFLPSWHCNKGYSVSMSRDGGFLVVGAPYEVDNTNNVTGAVRVYVSNESRYTLFGEPLIGTKYTGPYVSQGK